MGSGNESAGDTPDAAARSYGRGNGRQALWQEAADALDAFTEASWARLDPPERQAVTASLARVSAALDHAWDTIPRGPMSDDRHTVRLRLFGGVRVETAGQSTWISGRPGQLLAYLSLHEGNQPATAVAHALWPDAERDVGRARLRTVLARTKRTAGAIIGRTDSSVHMEPHVVVDWREFETLAERASFQADGWRRDAVRAIGMARAPLAPELSHLDWLSNAQRQVQQRVSALIDLTGDPLDDADES